MQRDGKKEKKFQEKKKKQEATEENGKVRIGKCEGRVVRQKGGLGEGRGLGG